MSTTTATTTATATTAAPAKTAKRNKRNHLKKRPHHPQKKSPNKPNHPPPPNKNRAQQRDKPMNKPIGKKPATHQGESSSESGEDEGAAGQEHCEPSCLICCEPIRFYSVGRCNHREICSLCSVRRRRLYQQTDCCICKQPLDDVIFTADADKKFSDFQFALLASVPELLPGVRFADESYMKEISTMLREIKCPECADASFSALGGLKSHLRTVHKLLFCPVCLEHRKVFLHEQRLYTREDLNRHLKPNAGGNGGGLQPGEVEHRHCDFCRISLYDKDALHSHLIEKHERCHICASMGDPNLYFADYAALEAHFDKQHYLCHERSCLEKRFVVFRTPLDLRAHDIEAHVPHRKFQSRAEEREARRLDIVFSSRDPLLPTGPRSSVAVIESSSSPPTAERDNFPSLSGTSRSAATNDRDRNPQPPLRIATGVALNTEWGRHASTSSSAADCWPSLSSTDNNRANGHRSRQSRRQVAAASSWARFTSGGGSKYGSSSSSSSPTPPPRSVYYGGSYGY